MKHVNLKHAWIAIILTGGEFVAGFYIFFHHGSLLYIYLAITYASREVTRGGRHYHRVVYHLTKEGWKYWSEKVKSRAAR